MTTVATETVNIGLSSEQSEGVLAILRRVLADFHVLYVKTRKYHWNVTGPNFQQLHALFETQYTALEAEIDQVAERMRSVGGPATGSMAEFLRDASLEEETGSSPRSKTMLRSLLADHESVVRRLRQDIDACTDGLRDAGTADFLTGLLEAHEKTAWMLRAHLAE